MLNNADFKIENDLIYPNLLNLQKFIIKFDLVVGNKKRNFSDFAILQNGKLTINREFSQIKEINKRAFSSMFGGRFKEEIFNQVIDELEILINKKD